MGKAEDLATKGEDKLRRKLKFMPGNYKDSKDRAVDHYEEVGFLKPFNDAYEASWDDNPKNYANNVKPGLEKKWRENWLAKMFGIGRRREKGE